MPRHLVDREGGSLATLDLDLVRRCCRGESAAWTAFLPFFQEIGKRVLRGFQLADADKDDVLAQVVADLYDRGLRTFRGDSVGELVNFIKRAVRNRALDRVREVSRLVGLADIAEPVDLTDVPGVADRECEEFLRAELEQLSRRDRELYLMRFRGLKEREIAEQTGTPPGTVAAQVSRHLAHLRQRLVEKGC